MDAVEQARRRYERNKANRERSAANMAAKALEQKEEVQVEPTPEIVEASVEITQAPKVRDGDISIVMCFSGAVREYKFHCPNITGSFMPSQMQQVLLEMLVKKFGTRTVAK